MSAKTAAERHAKLNGNGPTKESLVDCARDGDAIVGEATLGEIPIEFEARNVRMERSGVHARISVTTAEASLAYSILNVDRDEDRTRLANSASRRLGDPRKYADAVKLRLDQFCAVLWREWVRGEQAAWESGLDRKTAWLLHPYMLDNAGTILFGPPSAAKSWLTLAWTLAISHNAGPWRVDRSGPVLFVNLERPPHLVRARIREVALAVGTDERALIKHARGRTLADVCDSIVQTVQTEGCAAVIVDSLSRSGTGDLTQNEPANRAMDVLNGLGCAWCIIAHTPRSDPSHLYGSVMFEAAADLMVSVTPSEAAPERESGTSIGIKLDVTKANDVRKPRPEMWAFDFGDDDAGLTRIRRPEPGEFTDLEDAGKSVEDHILSAIGKEPKTAAQIAQETGLKQTVVAATCRRSKRVTDLVAGGGRGKSTLWAPAALEEEPA